MAGDLAAADRQRRELIANVSHELRTPITALQGVLENIVDGVAEPDPATLRDRARPDRAARPAGHRAARPVPARRRRAAAATASGLDVADLLDEVVAEAAVTAAAAGRDVRFVRPPDAPAVPSTPTRPGCTRCWRTCWTTPPGTARPDGTVWLSGRADGGRVRLRGRRRGAGHPAGAAGPGVRTVHPRRPGDRRRHRPRAGHRRWVVACTAVRSGWSTGPRGCLVRVSLPAEATDRPHPKAVAA